MQRIARKARGTISPSVNQSNNISVSIQNLITRVRKSVIVVIVVVVVVVVIVFKSQQNHPISL